MLALREVVELEKRGFADPYFQYFKQVLASILVKLILDRLHLFYLNHLYQASHFISISFPSYFHNHHVPLLTTM
jgi:hypothetical protein